LSIVAVDLTSFIVDIVAGITQGFTATSILGKVVDSIVVISC